MDLVNMEDPSWYRVGDIPAVTALYKDGAIVGLIRTDQSTSGTRFIFSGTIEVPYFQGSQFSHTKAVDYETDRVYKSASILEMYQDAIDQAVLVFGSEITILGD